MQRLIIPGTIPSVNHQYRNVTTAKGRRMRLLTTKAAKWEREVTLLIKNWIQRTAWQQANTKVIVRLWYFYPDKRRRDAHNTLKLLLDVCEGAGVFTDDKLALPQIMDFEVDRENPRTEIEFEVMQVG